MHKVVASAVVDIPIDQAWAKLSDLSKAHYYVPDLTGTEFITEQKQGVGASRYVYSNRAPLIETVTQWNEGQGFSLRLHHDKGDGVPPMFSRARFHYSLEPISDSQTKLINSMEFEMKWGPIGQLLAKLIVKPMQQMQEKIVVGQKLYYETGDKADPQQVIKILKNQQ